MNEIAKLYKNAGVNKIFKYYECSYGISSIQVCPIPLGDCIGMCDRKSIWEYPPFTSEKQLKFIKWLAIRFNSDYMAYWHNEIKDVWIFRLYDLTEISSEEPYIYEGRNKDFTEALCDLFNDLWQDLTEEERRQIKDILQ